MMQTGKNVLFLILIQRIVYFAAFAPDKESLSRSAYFTTHENRRLKGHLVKMSSSPSLMSCNKLCLTNSWCTSTNFKKSSKEDGKGTCELNKHDISVIYEDNEFHDQEDVTFSLLLEVSWWVLNKIILLVKFDNIVTRKIHVSFINSELFCGCFALQFLSSWSKPQEQFKSFIVFLFVLDSLL